MTAQSITVSLGNRSYDIVIGADLLTNVADLVIPFAKTKRIFVITDQTAGEIYYKTVENSLRQAGYSVVATAFPAGESSKSLAMYQQLVDTLLQQKIERSDLILALGGGVTGDLAGFVAATTLRGIPFIQIPTTLLAQVDSSVGGKTGINTPHGKNLLGAFYQPRRVIIDVNTLTTLPERQLKAGYIELLKHAIIKDAKLFRWLDEHAGEILQNNSEKLIPAISQSCAIKADVVAADEREQGQRALLNFGHTFGHAFEAAAGYSDRLLHGEAIAIGIYWAALFSEQLGTCPTHVPTKIVDHLTRYNLLPETKSLNDLWNDTDALINLLMNDKKVSNQKLTFILCRELGDAFIQKDVPLKDVKLFIEKMQKAA